MTSAFWLAFIKGYTTTFGLIVAIGAQNAFILRQGLLKSHILVVAILASLIDAFMISISVTGVGAVITSPPPLLITTKYAGILFLFLYGCKCFYSSLFKSEKMVDAEARRTRSLKLTILTLLAVSFLNPHMYLDTILIGTIGAALADHQQLYYILGAILGSTVWFFALSYGAGFLVPIFKKPIAWKILDIIIGAIMWGIALSVCYI